MKILGYEIKKVNNNLIRKEGRMKELGWLSSSGRKRMKSFAVSAERLEVIAKTDPMTWSIIKTIKSIVNSVSWNIIPDTSSIVSEILRWKQVSLLNLSNYNLKIDFKTSILKEEIKGIIYKGVKSVLESPKSKFEKIDELDMFFKIVVGIIEQEAIEHCFQVGKIFKNPNNHLQPTWNLLTEYLLGDILIHDAGVLIKNYNYGNELAEIYTVKGSDIKRYLNNDGTVPDPPEPAFVYEKLGSSLREYTKDELIYISQNPQEDGFGLSSLEVAMYVIMGSLYADSYNIEFFKSSNVPVGLMDLGPDVDETTRATFEQMWNAEIVGKSLYKVAFISGASGDKKFIPIQGMTHREMQFMEYLKWTTSVKCACFGLCPQDVGLVQDFHRTTSVTQQELTKVRGIRNILKILSSQFNNGIVKEYKYEDVKFSYEEIDLIDKKVQTEIDMEDIKAGIISRDDRRKKLGLPPIEGGNVITITTPQGLIPIESLYQLEYETKQKLVQTETQITHREGQLIPGINITPVLQEEEVGKIKEIVRPEDLLNGLLRLRENIESELNRRKSETDFQENKI